MGDRAATWLLQASTILVSGYAGPADLPDWLVRGDDLPGRIAALEVLVQVPAPPAREGLAI